MTDRINLATNVSLKNKGAKSYVGYYTVDVCRTKRPRSLSCPASAVAHRGILQSNNRKYDCPY